jgi:hypothetical protein
MNDYAFLIFAMAGLIGAGFALGPWRLAFVAALVLGFIQDPLRKVVPEQPVMLVLLSTLMMLAALFGAATRAGPLSLRPLTLGQPKARLILQMFIGLVCLQAVLSLVRFGSVQVAVIGLISYLAPFPAIWLASRYLHSQKQLIRILWIYCGFGLALGFSVYASQFGVKSILLEEVGEGLVVYDRLVGILDTYPGYMRSTEIAAWHISATACFLIILAVATGNRRLWFIVPPLVVFLVSASLLTARRKSMVAVVIFVAIYFLLLLYYRQRTGSKVLVFSTAIGGLMVLGSSLMGEDAGAIDPYAVRAQSVWGDLWNRLYNLAFASVGWALGRAGFLGLGAGSVGQGTQYFGGATVARGAAEGGLGKIVVELGVPGLLLAIGVAIVLATTIRRILSVSMTGFPVILRFSLGLLAFCITNVSVFVNASQAFGDPFILFILGSCMGFILAAPRLMHAQLSKGVQQQMVVEAASEAAMEGGRVLVRGRP